MEKVFGDLNDVEAFLKFYSRKGENTMNALTIRYRSA